MIKKLVFATAVFIGGTALQAQNNKIETALVNLRDGDVPEAKKNIDAAARHESTSNSAKMYFVRGKVYYEICADKNFQNLDTNAPYIALEGFVMCQELEAAAKKKNFSDEANDGMVNTVSYTYNKGTDYIMADNLPEGIRHYNMVRRALKLDKRALITGIQDATLLQYIADAALKIKNYTETRKYLDELMVYPKYNEPRIYMQMAATYLENEKDTAKALEYLEKGSIKFPLSKDIINYQLSIYIEQRRIGKLIDKFTAAIELDSTDDKLYYNRGICYDRLAADEFDKASKHDDSTEMFQDAIDAAKTPAEKAAAKKKLADLVARTDAFYKAGLAYFQSAEADYKKAIAIENTNADTWFNLGALYYNRNVATTFKKNNLDPASPKYAADRAKADKEISENYAMAIECFQKALDNNDVSSNRELHIDIYDNLNRTYSNMKNYEKADEYRKLKEDLEAAQ